MKTLNTQDFLDSFKTLQEAKYPSLPTSEHRTLATVLTVAIEFGRTLEEIQEHLDKMTREQGLELELYLAETIGD